ncbi:MAG: lysophospholipid acyltransferase family protein [Chloroflexota bacterium]
MRKASYRLVNGIVKLGFMLLTRTRVVGGENIPRQGPAIMACNHLSMSDPPLLVACLPRKLTFVGKVELWRNPVLGALADWYGAFPVDRRTTDTGALRRSLQVLKEGGALVVFPEGTRSLEARLLPGQPGAALVALRSGAPVLPVAITGTTGAGLNWVWRRPRVTVSIGRPFTLSKAKGKPLTGQLAPATEAIMRSIAALLPPQHRGAYGEEDRGV